MSPHFANWSCTHGYHIPCTTASVLCMMETNHRRGPVRMIHSSRSIRKDKIGVAMFIPRHLLPAYPCFISPSPLAFLSTLPGQCVHHSPMVGISLTR